MSFFSYDTQSKLQRVEQLVAKDKDGTKQTEKVSECSPGPVSDEEILARSLEYPNKFTDEGGLSDTLFQDAFTHGASAQRLPGGWDIHSSDVHSRFEFRAKSRREGTDGRPPDPENLYIGAFHMSAAELRACKLDSDKASRVRIYDAGEAADQLHAEIVVDATGLSRPQRKEMRVRLMVLAQRRGLFVSPHLPAEDFGRAERSQCEMHLPPVHESIRYSGQSSAT
jgi:hypothetical protein